MITEAQLRNLIQKGEQSLLPWILIIDPQTERLPRYCWVWSNDPAPSDLHTINPVVTSGSAKEDERFVRYEYLIEAANLGVEMAKIILGPTPDFDDLIVE